MKSSRIVAIVASCGIALGTSATASRAGSLADFYKGKDIQIVVGYPAGNAYDQDARLIARHIGDHIPGHPAVIVQNMPGAGTRKVANWLFHIAPRDGTTMGSFSQNLPMDQILDKKGVRFDVRKFNWIGNPGHNNNVLFVWHTTGIRTIAEATKKPLIIGAGAGGNTPAVIYPEISDNFFGTKFRVITGYHSREALLAVERQEVAGLGSRSWASVKREKPGWLKDHKINILFQVGTERERDLPDVPLLTDLARTDEQRQVLEFISGSVAVGRPIVAPPQVAAPTVEALRASFDATMKDPKFLADAKKSQLVVAPTSGKKLQALVEKIADVPPHAVALLKAALKVKPGKRKKGGKE